METISESLIPLRVQVTVEQLATLKTTAARENLSLAELVRQVIDGWKGGHR
jgi:hypothetical protein